MDRENESNGCYFLGIPCRSFIWSVLMAIFFGLILSLLHKYISSCDYKIYTSVIFGGLFGIAYSNIVCLEKNND